MKLSWRRAIAIAGISLRRLTRDRVALFFTFMLPILIIVLLGFVATGNTLTVGIVRLGHGGLADQLYDDLAHTKRLTVHDYSSEDSLRRGIRRGVVSGGLVIPPNYDTALASSSTAARLVLVLDRTQRDSTAAQSRIDAAVARQSAIVAAARFSMHEVGGSFSIRLRDAQAIATHETGTAVVTRTAGHSALSGVNITGYATAGELVLFIFLIALTGAGDVVEVRRLGISRRMLASPTSPGTVMLGEGMGRFLVSVLQAMFIVAMGSLLFGFSWGNLPGVTALVAAFALVSTGMSLLVATVARSNEQATSVGPPVGLALAMLGGCMWPLEIVPPVMRTIGHLTPHAWALDGFIKLMGGDATIVDIAPQLFVLLGMAAVLLPLATWRLRRSIVA